MTVKKQQEHVSDFPKRHTPIIGRINMCKIGIHLVWVEVNNKTESLNEDQHRIEVVLKCKRCGMLRTRVKEENHDWERTNTETIHLDSEFFPSKNYYTTAPETVEKVEYVITHQCRICATQKVERENGKEVHTY